MNGGDGKQRERQGKAEKRAAALRENLRRRKEAGQKPGKDEKSNERNDDRDE